MAVVRELITVLGTAVDQTGFKQYETGIARVKALALSVGKAFGLVFGAEKIIEFADELVTAGKEINRLGAQLKVIGRPFDDMGAAQQRVYETAQLLGVEYKEVLSTFKDFYNEMRETDIPISKVEKTAENIFKALQVGKASNEETTRTLELFDRSFKRGGMRSVGVGILSDVAPVIFDKLKNFFHTTEEGLRAMAKAGELTAEKIVAALGETDVDLDKKWEQVPQKLGKVFTRINNDLVLATAAIYKLTDASVFFGKIVWFIWTRFRDAIVWVTESVGGLANAVQLLGIVLAVALGPWLLSTLTTAVALTLSWAASNALLLAQWLAVGAAVAAVALAISDLVFWMQGKRSVIGTWVGPFADLAENFKKLDIFSGFRLFGDAFTGNWDAFKKDWATFISSAPAEILLVTTAVAGIGIAFKAVTAIIEGVSAAIKALKVTTVAAEAGAAASAANAGGAGAAGAAGAAAGATATGTNVFSGLAWMGQKFTALVATFAGSKAIYDAAKDPEAWRKKWGQYLDDGKSPWADQKKRQPFNLGIMDRLNGAVTSPAPTVMPQESDSRSVTDLLRSLGERMWYGPEAIRNQSAIPTVPPGAFNPNAGPRISNTEINPSLVQNNNIRVETLLDSAQIGSAIQNQLTTYGEQLINGVSRQIRGAGPRAEFAPQ